MQKDADHYEDVDQLIQKRGFLKVLRVEPHISASRREIRAYILKSYCWIRNSPHDVLEREPKSVQSFHFPSVDLTRVTHPLLEYLHLMRLFQFTSTAESSTSVSKRTETDSLLKA